MRTTLTLENDAYAAAKSVADHENISLGQAASRLILQTVKLAPQKQKNKTGAVFRSTGGRYTSAQVEEALSDD